MDTNRILPLIGFISTPVIVSGLIAITQRNDIKTWYKDLIKPSLNPPNWIFGPVWTILYIMIGLSGYLVWERNPKFESSEMKIYAIQLFLNFIWSLIFFKAHAIFLALIEILFLLGSIFVNIYVFYRIYPLAAYLLVPYVLWVNFATYLNLSLWILNRNNMDRVKIN